jgi:plasmid stability protein
MTLHSLTVRGLPEPLLKALRAAAKRNRRSLNAEVLVRLEAGVASVDLDRRAGDAFGDGGSVSRGASAGATSVPARRDAGRSLGSATGRSTGATARVGDSVAPPYGVRRVFEEADRSRLLSDLALTPEQRVHLAEELARTAVSAGPRPRFQRVIQFDRYEDYLDWKRHGEREP